MRLYLTTLLGEADGYRETSAETLELAAVEAVKNHCGFNGARLGARQWRVQVFEPGPKRPYEAGMKALGIFTVGMQFVFTVEKA